MLARVRARSTKDASSNNHGDPRILDPFSARYWPSDPSPVPVDGPRQRSLRWRLHRTTRRGRVQEKPLSHSATDHGLVSLRSTVVQRPWSHRGRADGRQEAAEELHCAASPPPGDITEQHHGNNTCMHAVAMHLELFNIIMVHVLEPACHKTKCPVLNIV